MNTKPKAKTSEIIVQELEKELLVYDLQTNKVVCLNKTSAIIYQLCDGKRTIAEIIQTLNKNLKESIGEDFVWLALDSFKKENLLEESENFLISFNGLSRRQIIKKVGLGTMIALPLVSSLIAPTATNAASGVCVSNAAGCVAPGGIFTTIQPNPRDCPAVQSSNGCCSCNFGPNSSYDFLTAVCDVVCA